MFLIDSSSSFTFSESERCQNCLFSPGKLFDNITPVDPNIGSECFRYTGVETWDTRVHTMGSLTREAMIHPPPLASLDPLQDMDYTYK